MASWAEPGTISANVSNSGVLQPGLLKIDGGYTQALSGVTEVEIAGPNSRSGSDQLNITGTANLDGPWHCPHR